MRQLYHFLGLTIWLALTTPAFAQETRMVPVDGRAMRVQIAGLEHLGKVPTVIFESGGGGWAVDGWAAIFADIKSVAPVIAYDRAGGDVPPAVEIRRRLG